MRRSWFIIISLLLILSTTLVSADLDTDLVSYYNFDGDATDSVGSNDGTVTGATYITSGKINNGLNFGTTSDNYIVNIGDESTFKWITITGEFTFSVWEYFTDDATNYQTIFSTTTGSLGDKGFIFDRRSGKYFAYFYLGSGTAKMVTSSTSIIKNQWNHIVFTGDGTTVKIYINNNLDSNTVSFSGFGGTANDKWIPTLGGHMKTTNERLSGYLDEVAIWSRALSSTEVSELYNSGDGLGYPFTTPIYYGFNITASNSSASLTSFSATISNSSISYDYSTTNGTIQTNSTTDWSSGYYNISVTSTGYSDWGIDDYYWSSTEKNNLKAVLTAGTSSSNECTGNFYVSAGCTATLIAGDTWVVSSS